WQRRKYVAWTWLDWTDLTASPSPLQTLARRVRLRKPRPPSIGHTAHDSSGAADIWPAVAKAPPNPFDRGFEHLRPSDDRGTWPARLPDRHSGSPAAVPRPFLPLCPGLVSLPSV